MKSSLYMYGVGIISIVVIITLTLLFGISVSATSGTSNVIASVTVPAVCGIPTSLSAIDFGSLAPGESVNTNNGIIDTNTGGDIVANVLLSGTDWTSTSSSIGVSNTVYSAILNTVYANAIPLTLTPHLTTIIIGAYTSNTIYFGLRLPQHALKGIYSQTITIENSC